MFRRVLVLTLVLLSACSLVVDTSGLDDGPATKGDAATDAPAVVRQDGGGAAPDGTMPTVDGGGPLRGEAGTDAGEAGGFTVPACGTLAPGAQMHVEDRVTSCNNKFYLVYQADGNIVEYDSNGAIFATGTYNHPVDHAEMQTDGDFVVLGPQGERWFASGTAGFPGAYLSVQDDGHITVNTNVEHWRGNPEYGQ